MFDKLLKEKYQLSDDKFEKMSRKERKKILMKMLHNHSNIILFPSKKLQSIDGLPHLTIVHDSIKEVTNKGKSKTVCQDKKVFKPRVDMGIPPPKKGQENQARAGATFDPKQFKGNVMLFQHLNEVSISMLKHPVQSSESVNKRKDSKKTFGDYYGIKLLEEDQEKTKIQDSSSSSDEELDQKINVIVKLQSWFKPASGTPKLPEIMEVRSKWKDLKDHEGLKEVVSKHRNSKIL